MVHHMITRWLGVTAAVVGLLAVAAPVASAAQGDIALCTLTGVGTVTPWVGAVPNDGTYAFNGGANCVAVETDSPAAPSLFTAQVTSDGWYSNLVIGTGSLAGTACIAPDVPGTDFGFVPCPVPGTTGTPGCPSAGGSAGLPFPDYLNSAYAGTNTYTAVGLGIDLTGGTGTIGGGAVTPKEAATDNLQDAFALSGALTVAPTTPVTCGGLPAAGAFNVTGSFLLS
jgi:hypothetical protein